MECLLSPRQWTVTPTESIVTAVTTVSQRSTVRTAKGEQSTAKQLRILLNMVNGQVAVWEGLQQRGGVLGGAVKVHQTKTSKVNSQTAEKS